MIPARASTSQRQKNGAPPFPRSRFMSFPGRLSWLLFFFWFFLGGLCRATFALRVPFPTHTPRSHGKDGPFFDALHRSLGERVPIADPVRHAPVQRHQRDVGVALERLLDQPELGAAVERRLDRVGHLRGSDEKRREARAREATGGRNGGGGWSTFENQKKQSRKLCQGSTRAS